MSIPQCPPLSSRSSTAHRRFLHPFLQELSTTWRRWRAHLCKGGGVLATVLALVACSGPSEAAAPCPGSISLTWNLTDAQGQPSSCVRAGAANVALHLQSRAGGAPVFLAFPCRDGTGVANVPPNLYTVGIELHDALGGKIDTAPVQASVSVVSARTTALTPVTFHAGQPQPTSGVALRIQAQGSFTANCLPPSAGGAQITGTSITIERPGAGCVSTTFIRQRGGTEIGTYTLSCDTPFPTTCIEQDETLTAPNLLSGDYVMRISGLVGGHTCWRAESPVRVVPAGQPVVPQTITLLPINGC